MPVLRSCRIVLGWGEVEVDGPLGDCAGSGGF